MKQFRLIPFLAMAVTLLISEVTIAQTTATIGFGTSSSSTRGPIQRSDTASSTVYSRFVHIYTASELAAAGIPAGASITALNWELASSNIIIGSGDATYKVYIKNSSATEAVAGDWEDLIDGSALAVDNAYNTTNNFPGENGWMPFTFISPFSYAGDAIEIAVDWDCSAVSAPAFSGDGALKWRWESTAPDNLVVKKTSSSSASSNISDLKNERANIQIVYNESACPAPEGLSADNISTSSADLSWAASISAVSYNYKVVESGDGVEGSAVDQGSTASTSVSIAGLAPLGSYDLFVQADCGGSETSDFSDPFTFVTFPDEEEIATIGLGTSSSSTRGPFQRSDTASSTVYSRFVHIYSEAELAAAGIESGSAISALNWELASSNVIIGSGDATLKVYIKNSDATEAVAGDWVDLIDGSTLVVDNAYNTSNNFPGENGWMPFSFDTPFVYDGGALEIAVDWDGSQVSTPSFSGDGALKWRWESTAPVNSVVKKTSSSSPSTNISDLKNERANIQFVYGTPVAECANPYPQVDFNSLGSEILPNGKLEFTWEPIEGQIGCQINILVGDGPQQASIIRAGANASSFQAPVNQLVPFTTYNFRVRCGCSQNPLIAGDYTEFASAFYLPPAITEEMGTAYADTPLSLVNGDAQWNNTNLEADVIGDLFAMASSESWVRVAPNPAQGNVNLSYNSLSEGQALIRVFDAQGKLAFERAITFSEGLNSVNFNMNELENGIYIVEVLKDDSRESVRLLMN